MFLGTFRFEGDTQALTEAYDKMISMVPSDNLHLHVCIPDETGLTIYDSCPTREIFMAFSSSNDFQRLLSQLGMPMPKVTPVGEIHGAFVSGKRVI